MGSAASALAGDTPGADLRLQTSGLRFSAQQVRSLNSYVDTLYEEDQNGRMSVETECAVENLVQRIVDGAGQRDPRFRCCHLIALHREKKMRSRSLEYLVTIDSLPTLNSDNDDCCLEEGPVGYGKIKLSGREADKWAEFLTPSGYLCRDKVLERWVELIARCAAARGGGASRALGARAASAARPYTYCYLERASHRSSPERRLAIVEGASWVMVRVGAGEAEAKLALGAAAAGVGAHAYTTRVPLTHPLALLHYTAAQTGYYAVAIGPPSSILTTERTATWQLWHPALEATLDAHCSNDSSVGRIAGALNSLVDKMREGCFEGSAQLLSRYMVWCSFRRRLERCASLRSVARFCGSAHVAHHLLLVLDNVLHVCTGAAPAGLVWGVGRDAVARRGARAASWRGDAAAVTNCLLYLHRIAVGEDILQSPAERLEGALFSKWEACMRGLGGSKAGSTGGLPRGPLRYLSRVTRELLACKNMVAYDQQSTFRTNLIQATCYQQEHVEDLIHILAIMLDQARDLYLHNLNQTLGEDKDLSNYRSKKWNKLKDYYDASSACLIDAARRDPDLRREDLADHTNVMKNVLLWLHKGVKEDKKYLGPVLKPFLYELQWTAQENSWFLDDFDSKKCSSEFEGLAEYCLRVHEGLDPCLGLLEASKKFSWAKTLVDVVDRYRHVDFRLVFPTGEGLAVSYLVKLPSRRDRNSSRVLTLSRRDKADAKLKLARRCVLAAFHNALHGRPELKQISRHGSTEEILNSAKNGNFWRNTTKPDIIPSNSDDSRTLDLPKVRRRSRRSRPATSHGFPEISIVNQSDEKTLRRKYHTLKSLVYTEPVESIKEVKERPRSAGSSIRSKDALSRPSILETLDFINSVKDVFCVDESGTSDIEDTWSAHDDWLLSEYGVPLNTMSRGARLHLSLGDLVVTLLQRGKFTILQELCSWLGAAGEGALFALHRLARAARARSADRDALTWRLPEVEGASEPLQRYRAKPPDYVSGDEAPQPPPLPRNKEIQHKRHTEYDPIRLQSMEHHMQQLEQISSKLSSQRLNQKCTGIINPIYDIKLPKDKFSVKRTKSLGRSFSTRNVNIECSRYNLSLGHRNGRTNDVVTAISETTGETGLDLKNFFQRYNSTNIVGDSYRISRITID
ncbi:unnamed protein product, partial [Brenthis ino]